MKVYYLIISLLIMLVSCKRQSFETKPLNAESDFLQIPYIIGSSDEKEDTVFFNKYFLDIKRNDNDTLIADEKLAIILGYIYLSRLYGKETINDEFPLRIGTNKDQWVISGTLPKGYQGGVAVIYLNKINGEIEEYRHYK